MSQPQSPPEVPAPKFFPTLFKTSSKGAEQQWEIKVVPYDAGPNWPGEVWADVVTQHGQVDGKIQTATVQVRAGKNLGKANATTPFEQACAEAESKWKKQLDKGYSEQRGGNTEKIELLPMLAHKYEDKKHKVQFPVNVQPKLDGIRALAIRKGDSITLLSRQGKEHKHLDHIKEALLKRMRDGDIWDGELYIHGVPMQTIASYVKREQPDTLRVQYHVYDCVSDERFSRRFGSINLDPDVQEATDPGRIGPVQLVDTYYAYGPGDIETVHDRFVSEGYEGIMLRWGDEPYKRGYRSEHLLKVKAFQDAEFEIVDVVPGVGKESDKGTFVCKTDKGAIFNCRPKGRDEKRAEYLANKSEYIGKPLTVRFFEWTASDQPVPRFPVGVCVRDYEYCCLVAKSVPNHFHSLRPGLHSADVKAPRRSRSGGGLSERPPERSHKGHGRRQGRRRLRVADHPAA